MNTHQKVFFAGAVALGLVAEAFASTAPVKTAQVETITLPPAMVIYHRPAAVATTQVAEISLEPAMVIGHRSDLVASNAKAASKA